MPDITTIIGGEGMPAGDSLPLGKPEPKQRMRRPRRSSFTLDWASVAKQCTDDLWRDLNDRLQWNTLRVQRYAKMRGWLPDKRFPWQNASNCHIPIMMTDSLRVQDSLYNATMTATPPITSKANNATDKEKEQRVDSLLYLQTFVESNGERLISEMADTFVNDGTMLVFTPWVRENQLVADTHIFDPLPSGMTVDEYIRPLIHIMHKDAESITSKGEWSWVVKVPDKNTGKTRTINIDAYIEEEGGRVELVETGQMRTFDGPVPMVKSIEDWVIPFRSSNPQPPSPSNPNGAGHIILLDYPTYDEIARLKNDGYYDLCTEDDLVRIKSLQTPVSLTGDYNQQLKQLKDDFEGTSPTAYSAQGQPTMTRMTCFYGMDIDGDGVDEQVVIRMIRETSTVLRARLLTEEFPAFPPRRPLMMQQMIPVKDRAYGISLLELLEPIYDQMKIMLDQAVDSGTIKNMPWGMIKANSGIRNEPIQISPGTFYPTANPQSDLFIPSFVNGGEATFMNLITLFSQWADQEVMLGQLNFGQVPQGKSAALRTTGNMQAVLQQSDARPEHILRRFFWGLAEIYAQIHELNQSFLPKDKEILMVGVPEEGADVYQTITDREQIRGRFQFEFKATVLNTSKGLLQQALGQILTMIAQPLMLQMGLVGPEQMFNAVHDVIKAGGQDAARYLKKPSPDADRPKIDARQALSLIAKGEEPQGLPAEAGGAQEHLDTIQQLLESPDFALIPYDGMHQLLLKRWIQYIQRKAQEQAQQQQLMQAARQFQQSMGAGQGTPGAPPQGNTPPPQTGAAGNQMVSPNESMAPAPQGG